MMMMIKEEKLIKDFLGQFERMKNEYQCIVEMLKSKQSGCWLDVVEAERVGFHDSVVEGELLLR